MMNLKNYAEKLGKLIIIIDVLIDLKIEIKEAFVSVMRPKTLLWKVQLKQSIFD